MKTGLIDEETIYLPPFPTPAKAKKGDACNGCGWCCHLEVCRLGELAFPDAVAPCPAIVYQDGKVRCGLILGEMELMRERKDAEPILQDMLGIGKGCCADDMEDAA
jgi:hypothetical protein